MPTENTAKRAIDSVVESSDAASRLRRFKRDETDIGDLLRVEDPERLLVQYKDHLLAEIRSSTRAIQQVHARDLPTNPGNASKPVEVKEKVLTAYDECVNYIMILSRHLGYPTCTGHTGYDYGGDTDLADVTDDHEVREYYYLIRDNYFYVAANEFVARTMLNDGVITMRGYDYLMARARQQF